MLDVNMVMVESNKMEGSQPKYKGTPKCMPN